MTFRIGTPHTKNAGYFLNNKGLGAKDKDEADIQTCWHCQAIIKMQEWKDDGAFCRTCMKVICGPCGDRMLTYGCEPFLKKLEQYTESQVKYAQHLKVAGLDPVTPPPPLIIRE